MEREVKNVSLSVDRSVHEEASEKVDNLSKATEKLWQKHILRGDE